MLLLSGCQPVQVVPNRRGEVGGRSFEFSSGGSYHPDGRGEWIVKLRGDSLWIAQDRKGKIKEYGAFKLTAPEANKMWRLIDKASFRERRATSRSAGPEDIRYRFTLIRPGKLPHTIELLEREIEGDGDLEDLIRYESRLVKKYTGKKPKF